MAYYPTYMQPFGGGYPNMYNPPNLQMPQPQQQAQPMPTQTSNGILWAQGEAGAKAWAVAPGQSVTLMDSEAPVLYLKSADMSGVPSMRIFDLVERTQKPPAMPVAPKIDMSKYVTRSEFEALKAMITTTKEAEQNVEPTV